MLTLALTLPPQGPQNSSQQGPLNSQTQGPAGGMGQVAGRGCLRQGSPNNNTHKNSNRLSAEDRDAQCTHTRKAVEKT